MLTPSHPVDVLPDGPLVSVVLCAHNPHLRYLQATLDGLREQDLPTDRWELLLIDNCSEPPLVDVLDISWHPRGRIVSESRLGLAQARRRGYVEATGQLLVHCDDDTVLCKDYLSQAALIYQTHPWIGSFGGQQLPQFEVAPKCELERSFGGERLVTTDIWSNILDDTRTMPWGAGMCLRRAVVDEYLQQVENDPRRLILGRSGSRLVTGEDIDLNYVAVRTGFGTGLFKGLSLVHFIPPEKATRAHFIQYRAGNAYSMIVLWFLHTGELRIPRQTRSQSFFLNLRMWLRMSEFEREREQAMSRARRRAAQDLKDWGWLEGEAFPR